MDSEHLRVPFKVKVDYFILYLILVSTFVIFLLLFSMNKRRRTNEAENSSFIRMCTCSSVTEIKDGLSTSYQLQEIVRTSHINISILISIFIFPWMIAFKLVLLLRLVRFHYKNCKNTKQSLRFRILFFLPNLYISLYDSFLAQLKRAIINLCIWQQAKLILKRVNI